MKDGFKNRSNFKHLKSNNNLIEEELEEEVDNEVKSKNKRGRPIIDKNEPKKRGRKKKK